MPGAGLCPRPGSQGASSAATCEQYHGPPCATASSSSAYLASIRPTSSHTRRQPCTQCSPTRRRPPAPSSTLVHVSRRPSPARTRQPIGAASPATSSLPPEPPQPVPPTPTRRAYQGEGQPHTEAAHVLAASRLCLSVSLSFRRTAPAADTRIRKTSTAPHHAAPHRCRVASPVRRRAACRPAVTSPHSPRHVGGGGARGLDRGQYPRLKRAVQPPPAALPSHSFQRHPGPDANQNHPHHTRLSAAPRPSIPPVCTRVQAHVRRRCASAPARPLPPPAAALARKAGRAGAGEGRGELWAGGGCRRRLSDKADRGRYCRLGRLARVHGPHGLKQAKLVAQDGTKIVGRRFGPKRVAAKRRR